MHRFVFVPQLKAADVTPLLRRHGYVLPDNIRKDAVSRWHRGVYYNYGRPDAWIPLNDMGGMATKAFHAHTVTFPATIDKELRMLLVEKRIEARARFNQSKGGQS